jgi:hypothetical protein
MICGANAQQQESDEETAPAMEQKQEEEVAKAPAAKAETGIVSIKWGKTYN